MSVSEPENILAIKDWLAKHGGGLHHHVRYSKVPSGLRVVAQEALPADTKIVTCPFSLAITQEVAQKYLSTLIDVTAPVEWTARQWISCYIISHWITENASLPHLQYLNTLPPRDRLQTPLHFTPLELSMFRGTNLYGATMDREREWRDEWIQCRAVFTSADATLGANFTWESYLTAATYISSRAFPSSLLSPNPSLRPSPSTDPILLPGIDSLNHARGQPVSWVVSHPDANDTEALIKEPSISLVLHTSAIPGQELYNNYGAKPNSELILGYGFSLPENPDDTIVLKIGGIEGKKWEVGRAARGASGLWTEILESITQDPNLPPNYEDQLDAAGILMEMSQTFLDRLPSTNGSEERIEMRPEVALMLHNYVEGQRDVLESLIKFAHEKERLAIEAARADGIKVVLEAD